MPDEKEPIPQFAARIKQKYPEYKDINDTVLVQKIVEKYPEYRDSVDLSGIEQPVKKKVGSIVYPELESETPSISKKTDNEIVGLANEFTKVSEQVKAIEQPITSAPGFVPTPQATSRTKNRLTQIESEIKEAGYDPQEVLKEFSDFPADARGVDIAALLKEKKENPLSYRRHKAAFKWQSPLFRNIEAKNPTEANDIISRIMSGQSGGDYLDKRMQTVAAIEAVKKYVDDEDEQRALINQIAIDKAASYGIDTEQKMQTIGQDERYLGGSGLNKYQISALHFLQDTDPEKYKLYDERMAAKPKGLWGEEDLVRGYEYKARELESMGMDLERRALEERMTNLQNKGAANLSEEELAAYNQLYSQYETLQQDIEEQGKRFPNIAALDADVLAQEALGQRNGALKRGILGVGENVGDTVNFVADILQSPFRSKEERVIDDLEDLGNKKFIADYQRYRTSKNQLFQPDYIPDFKKPLADEISKVNEGSLDERLSKVRELVLNNFDKVGYKKNPEAGKFNFTTNAVFNTVSDVGAEIASSIGIGMITGMPVSKVGRIGSMFASTFATAYNDYYNEGIEKDVANPTTYALRHTTKEALSELINNDLSVLNRMVSPRSTLAQIAKRVTKKEWDDLALIGKGRFSKALEIGSRTAKGAFKNAFQEDIEEVAAQVSGNLINMSVYGEDVDLVDGVGATIVNTTIGTLPFGGLGVVGQVREMNRNQKYALYEAAQNKDKYLAQLAKDVQLGVVKPEKADKIKAIIENSANTLNRLAEKNTINVEQTDNEKVDILAKNVQLEEAKELLQKGVESGKIKGQWADLAETKPEKLLEDISKQAQNLNDKFIPHNDGREEESRQAAEEQFGNKLVEAAISLFPKNQAEQSQTEGAAENVVPSTLDDIYFMSGEELNERQKKTKSEQKQKLIDAVGKEWYDKYILATSEVKSQMEDDLNDEQKKVFGGVGVSDSQNPEVIRDLREKILGVEGSENANDLGFRVRQAIVDLANKRNEKQSVAILNAAAKRADELGIDKKELQNAVISDLREQVGDENAKSILDTYFSNAKPQQQSNIEGQPPISEPPPPQGSRVFSERPATELSYRGLQDVANEFSLPDVESRDRKSDIRLRQDARETVDDWAAKGQYASNIEQLIVDAEEGGVLTDKERVILEGHLANVQNEARNIDKFSPEYDEKLKEISRLKKAGQKTRGEAGAALRIPIGGSRPRTVEDALVEEAEDRNVDVLTPEEKATVIKEFEDLEKAKQDFNDYVAKKEADFAAKQAEAELNKTKAAAKKTKKTDADYTAERKSLKDELAAARKEHEDFLKGQGIQKSGFGSLTGKEATIIAKIVRSYADQGITKLSEVVERVFDEIKGIIPGIEKADVVDVISGAYNEKKPTRNKLAETMVNLKTQANLIKKLEALESGQEPKSEKRKIQRNKEIKDLRDKIKGHDLTKLSQAKQKIKDDIEKIEQQIKAGDYSTPEKKAPIKLDAEGHKLRDKLIKLQQQADARRLLLQRQNEGGRERALRLSAEVLNVPRTLMTIADLSALLRQNIFFSAGHPLKTAKAIPKMLKAFVSQPVYDRWFADLKDSPRYEIIKDSNLAIADSLSHDLSKREEEFMSSLAEKIPIIGRTLSVGKAKIPGLNIVKGSERSYTMLLNKMRVDVFNMFVDKLEARGITYENSPKVYKAVAEYVNNATGRSDFGKNLNRIAPILNGTFFSPRLIASRVNMLTYWAQPRFWTTLPREARLDYFRNWASLLAVGGTILALAQLGGADEVETDPRSSDFGKIKDGDTRWDIWGGAQPYVRTLAQMWKGERKSTKSGKIYELNGDDIFGETRGGVALDFFRNKLAPVPGAFVDVLSGRTSVGDRIIYEWGGAEDKEISIDQYIKQRLLPMTFTGTQEAMKDQGVKALFTVGVPNILGVGTQTYDSSPASSGRNAKPTKPSKPQKPTKQD